MVRRLRAMTRYPLLVQFAVLGCAWGLQPAAALTVMEDSELAAVRGAGVAFNLLNYSLSGDLSLTYVAKPATANVPGQYLSLSHLALSRSDDPDATFTDPYSLSIGSRPGLPDVIRLSEPRNANGLLKWQFAADWTVGTEDNTFNGGALLVQDLQNFGGSLSMTTPTTPGVEGVVFGQTIRTDIGAVALRPRGREDASNEVRFSGIHVSDADGVSPWVLADVTAQPGIFNAITEDGKSFLHIGIAWPTDPAKEVSAAKIVVDNITFRNDQPTFIDPVAQTPTSTLSLGSSSIGSMQVQYFDMKLRAGR